MTKTTKAKKSKVYVKVKTTSAMKKREAKSTKLYGEFVEGWDAQLASIFNTDSEEFKRMMAVINSARKAKLPHEGNHAHHIIPRSYYKKYGKEVDNSEKNLVVLTPAEHFIVHYYAWKCAKKVMKSSMAYAFRLMYALAGKSVSEQNVAVFAGAFSDAWCTKMKKKAADRSSDSPPVKDAELDFLGWLSLEDWARLLGTS